VRIYWKIEHEDCERQMAVYSQLAAGAALGENAVALRKMARWAR